MEKYSQKDLVVLFLAGRDGWLHSYLLNGVQFGTYFLGSQSDKRAIELFGVVQGEEEKSTKRIIDGNEYTILTKKLDGRRVYRAFLSKEKPKKPSYTIQEINGERVAVLTNT